MIALRVKNAVGELEDSKHMEWDLYIVNDDISQAYQQLEAVTADVRATCAAARGK